MENQALIHEPVLKQELLEYLDLSQSNTVIDATIGFGGHANAILQRLGEDGRLIGMERDPVIHARVSEILSSDPRVKIVHENYRNLGRVLNTVGIDRVDAIYFDLGVNSYHLDQSTRGFSFEHDQDPLDMRFDPGTADDSAREYVNELSEDQLLRLLEEFGDVRHAHSVVRAIVDHRPLNTVADLRKAVEDAVPPPYRNAQLARVFQAIRIHVNQELEHLEEALETAVSQLRPGGRLAVISFHSGEDRIVKHFFREQEKDCVCPPDLPVCACEKTQSLSIINRSPLTPGKEEKEANSRSRSAKLRVAEKTA